MHSCSRICMLCINNWSILFCCSVGNVDQKLWVFQDTISPVQGFRAFKIIYLYLHFKKNQWCLSKCTLNSGKSIHGCFLWCLHPVKLMLTDSSHFTYSVDDSPHPPAVRVQVLVSWRSLKMKNQTYETCLSVMSWVVFECLKSKGGLWEWLWFAEQDPRRLWGPSAVLGGAGQDEGTSLSLSPPVADKALSSLSQTLCVQRGLSLRWGQSSDGFVVLRVTGTSQLFLWLSQTCFVYNFSLSPLLLSPSDEITSKYVVCVFWLGC